MSQRAFVHTPHCALPTPPPTEIADLPGVLVMGGSDVTDPLVQERVRELLGRRGADVVMRSACIVELSDFLFYLHKVCRIFATVLCKAFKSQCTLWFIDENILPSVDHFAKIYWHWYDTSPCQNAIVRSQYGSLVRKSFSCAK